jgi:hypothetical protein
MNLRQSLALGVIAGVIGLAGLLFHRRSDYRDLSALSNRPLFALFCCLVCFILLLAILLATPATNSDLRVVFHALMVVCGALQALVGGIGYLFLSDRVAGKFNTTVHRLFQGEVAIAHLAIGIVCVMAGTLQTSSLLVLILLIVWGWSSASLHMWRSFHGLGEEPATDAGMHACEFFFNLACPFFFLVLYLVAFLE